MNKKTAFIFFIIIIILILFILFIFNKKQKDNQNVLKINKCGFKIKYALTLTEKKQGLSGIKKMGEFEAMLFIYQEPKVYHFWMKGMEIPLDFVWIKEDKIIDLDENVPSPGKSGNIARVSPAKAVDKVLEINAGMIKKCQIKIGDKVSFNN